MLLLERQKINKSYVKLLENIGKSFTADSIVASVINDYSNFIKATIITGFKRTLELADKCIDDYCKLHKIDILKEDNLIYTKHDKMYTLVRYVFTTTYLKKLSQSNKNYFDVMLAIMNYARKQCNDFSKLSNNYNRQDILVELYTMNFDKVNSSTLIVQQGLGTLRQYGWLMTRVLIRVLEDAAWSRKCKLTFPICNLNCKFTIKDSKHTLLNLDCSLVLSNSITGVITCGNNLGMLIIEPNKIIIQYTDDVKAFDTIKSDYVEQRGYTAYVLPSMNGQCSKYVHNYTFKKNKSFAENFCYFYDKLLKPEFKDDTD